MIKSGAVETTLTLIFSRFWNIFTITALFGALKMQHCEKKSHPLVLIDFFYRI
jgi:hypothetical protein